MPGAANCCLVCVIICMLSTISITSQTILSSLPLPTMSLFSIYRRLFYVVQMLGETPQGESCQMLITLQQTISNPGGSFSEATGTEMNIYMPDGFH